MQLTQYPNDGANYQTQAVLAFLRHIECGGKPTIARWINGRENGYVCSILSANFRRQLNIAFFEHRNSDSICAVKWEQLTLNPPTIATAEFGDVYSNKWDVSKSVSYGKIVEMAEWIIDELSTFFDETAIE